MVAYALAGTVNIDLTKDPIARDPLGNEFYLKDIWPSDKEIQEIVEKNVSPEMFEKQYSSALEAPRSGNKLKLLKVRNLNGGTINLHSTASFF